MEGHLRNAASVDADGRQGAARADAMAQPFLARHAATSPRAGSRRSPMPLTAALSHRVRFHRPCAVASHQRRPFAPGRAAADHGRGFYADVMQALRELGIDVRIDEMPNEIRRRGAVQRRPHARRLRPRLCEPVLPRAAACRPGVLAFPHGLYRQGEPGAFLLGQLRSCGDALFRPARAAAPGGVPNLPDAVAREAYSHEVSSAGFWPGGGPIDYPAFYSYAYPAPEGFAEARGAAEAGVLLRRTSANSSCRMTRCGRRANRRRC